MAFTIALVLAAAVFLLLYMALSQMLGKKANSSRNNDANELHENSLLKQAARRQGSAHKTKTKKKKSSIESVPPSIASKSDNLHLPPAPDMPEPIDPITAEMENESTAMSNELARSWRMAAANQTNDATKASAQPKDEPDTELTKPFYEEGISSTSSPEELTIAETATDKISLAKKAEVDKEEKAAIKATVEEIVPDKVTMGEDNIAVPINQESFATAANTSDMTQNAAQAIEALLAKPVKIAAHLKPLRAKSTVAPQVTTTAAGNEEPKNATEANQFIAASEEASTAKTTAAAENTSTTTSETAEISSPQADLVSPHEAPKLQLVTKTALGNTLTIKPVNTAQAFVRYTIPASAVTAEKCSLRRFNVIDFETANMYPDSICQIGIAVVDERRIVKTKSFLVRPPYNDFRNTHIHGLKLNDVLKAPTFAELWPEVKPYIENKLIAAYSADFDIGCLLATLENFGLAVPDFAYFDILENARLTWRKPEDVANHKLSTLAAMLGIEYKAHEATSDAVAAAEVQFACNMPDTDGFLYTKESNPREKFFHLLSPYTIFDKAREFEKYIDSINIADYEDIFRAYDFALKNGMDKAKVLKQRGSIYEKCGLIAEAIKCYEEAINIDERIGLKTRLRNLKADAARNAS